MPSTIEMFREFDSFQEFDSWRSTDDAHARRRLEQLAMQAWDPDEKSHLDIPGWCVACATPSLFSLDYKYANASPSGFPASPNWRERLVCHGCKLNNRARSAISITSNLVESDAVRIWVAEQVTPLYRWLKSRYPGVTGSEFIDAQLPSGYVSHRGIRHEDVTATSFASASLDVVMSFDVLEHVPRYEAAFAETCRVLRPGGHFLWTAPFRRNQEKTIKRATTTETGEITHLLTPQYHGDPLRPDAGVLCFQEFGWSVLDELKEAGFEKSVVVLTWSWSNVNLGPELITIRAQKSL